MGSVGKKELSVKEPIFDTQFYKSTTQQMKDLITDVYKDMQEEFPILSENPIKFVITNGGNCEAIGDEVWINGRHMKQGLKYQNISNERWYRRMVAHELTHVIQSMLGKKDDEEISTKILDSAVNKYIANNSDTKEQVYEDLKKEYGVRDLDIDPKRRPNMERMAVAVETWYLAKHLNYTPKQTEKIANIGKYVVDELKKVM